MSTKTFTKALANSLLDFLFPRLCLNCSNVLPYDLNLLCAPCLSEMQFSDPEELCKHCASFKGDDHCKRCPKNPSPFLRTLALFHEKEGAKALSATLSREGGGFLAESIAGMLLVQMERAGMPFPEIWIPAQDKGSKIVAQALEKITSIPSIDCIKKGNWIKPKATLKKKQTVRIEEKNICLVCIGPQRFASLAEEGEVLAEAYPKTMNALMLSREL